jgi:hypothetical protein
MRMRRAMRFMCGMLGFRVGGQGGGVTAPSNALFADDSVTPLLADDNVTFLLQG